MFVIRDGGKRIPATYDETAEGVASRKTGLLVNMVQILGGEVKARPHLGTANLTVKPNGLAYRDPSHYTRVLMGAGVAGDTADTFVEGNLVDVVQGEFWGYTDQVENGDYAVGNLVGPSENGKLKVVTAAEVLAGTAVVVGRVLEGVTVTNGNKPVDILFNLPGA